MRGSGVRAGVGRLVSTCLCRSSTLSTCHGGGGWRRGLGWEGVGCGRRREWLRIGRRRTRSSGRSSACRASELRTSALLCTPLRSALRSMRTPLRRSTNEMIGTRACARYSSRLPALRRRMCGTSGASELACERAARRGDAALVIAAGSSSSSILSRRSHACRSADLFFVWLSSETAVGPPYCSRHAVHE